MRDWPLLKMREMMGFNSGWAIFLLIFVLLIAKICNA